MTDPKPQEPVDDLTLGKLLVESGALTPQQLETTLQSMPPEVTLKQELVKRGLVKEDVIFQSLTMLRPGTEPSKPSSTKATVTAGTLSPSAISQPGTLLPPEVIECSKNPKNKFGKYILVKQLGAGGMAVVYKAWDTFLNHYVALKFIKTQEFVEGETQASIEQVEAFLAEARLSVRLNHPNIARVYELGKEGDKFFMAQYYIDGPNLHEVVHGGKGPSVQTMFYQEPKRFIGIMRDISSAMAYAHSLQPPIIHRDLKPANVMLDSSGRAYVVDFGLAKELKVGQHSVSGVIKGTPKYMAPEQAEGHSSEIDHRTDIWALGVILYEMLTGRGPFEADNLHHLLNKIVNDEPVWPRQVVNDRTAKIAPSSKGALSVNRDLELVCMKCLHKDKRHRYASAQELADDLNRVLQGEPISVSDNSLTWVAGRVIRRVKKNKWAFVAVAALLVALLGVGVWAMTRPKADPKEQIANFVALGDKALAEKKYQELLTIATNIASLDPNHPKVAEYRKAYEDSVRKRLEELIRDGDAAVRDGRFNALPAIQDAIKAIEPRHPKIAEYETAKTASADQLKQAKEARQAFLDSPSADTLGRLSAFVKGSPSLATVALDGVGAWWSNCVAGLKTDADDAHGKGRDAWLEKPARDKAQNVLQRLALADAVLRDADVLQLPKPDLADIGARMREILDWKGAFTLVADVRPWASVKIAIGGRPHALDPAAHDNVTPLHLAGLPVGDLKLEFARGGAAKSLDVPSASLRPGAVLRVWGTLEGAIDHRIE
jgi:serine/threonine protein kinase